MGGYGGRMSRRVLHVLSQRPLRTGSGITLDALASRAGRAGWEQRVVCAAPVAEPVQELGGLGAEHMSVLSFETPAMPFAIPGMSDVMPYASRRFSSLSTDELAIYASAWRVHLGAVVADFRPHVIHVHHLWLVASMIKDVAPDAMVLNHCHGTGLRQMRLCPALAPGVIAGCARNSGFFALHREQADEIAGTLGVPRSRIHVVGAGYRADVFGSGGSAPRDAASLVFAGKLATAKGLPVLLDAVEQIAQRRPIVLHVAGGGSSEESSALRERMQAMSPVVRVHGMLSQRELAALLGASAVFVLPSMFEGLPLVLAEALACGCRVVATDLPGVREVAAELGEVVMQIPTPRRVNVDQPVAEDLPAFVGALEAAIEQSLDLPPVEPGMLANRLRSLTWDAVFDRIEEVWHEGV